MVGRRVSAYRALASESRVKLLHALQQSDGPMTVDDLAAAIDLHVNTAREHLDRLIAAGFVSREPEIRCTRGRPRMLYRAVERATAEVCDDRAREQLTRILVEGYGHSSESPSIAAETAGFGWADRLSEPTTGADAEAGPDDGALPPPNHAHWLQLAALEAHFEDLGFEPEADLEHLAVHLHRCPFYELARESTEVVCSVHLGLSRGVLARAGGPLVAEQLEPFVGPHHCVLHLAKP